MHVNRINSGIGKNFFLGIFSLLFCGQLACVFPQELITWLCQTETNFGIFSG